MGGSCSVCRQHQLVYQPLSTTVAATAGCDAIATYLIVAMLLGSLNVPPDWHVLAVAYTIYVPWLLAHWEEYHTGESGVWCCRGGGGQRGGDCRWPATGLLRCAADKGIFRHPSTMLPADARKAAIRVSVFLNPLPCLTPAPPQARWSTATGSGA